jgi:LacI family transcriptional regulator
MATMADVARRAGVSVSTVSHVVNGTRFVSDAARRQVTDAIRDTGYTPNTIARSLVTASTQSLGLAISAISNFYFTDLVSAIESSARAAGYTLLLADTHDDPEEELRVVRALHQRRVDGVLLAPATGPRGAGLRYLTGLNVPAVLVDRCASPRFDQVGTENVAPMAHLVRHLAERGHRRIALISGLAKLSTTAERVRGYREGLRAAGLPYEPGLVADGGSHADRAAPAVDRLLGRTDPPTALVVGNNHMTIGAMRALRRRGVRVPDDLAVASFDDFEWADTFAPRLTTIAQPIHAIGAEAVGLLLARLADPARRPRTIRLPATFMHRDSCGCGPGT